MRRPHGNLIVGTLGAGVFWYEPEGKYRQISTGQGLSSAYVLSLCLDQGGNLWVGTDGGGLDRIKRKIFNTPDGAASLERPIAGRKMRTAVCGSLLVLRARRIGRTNIAQDFASGSGCKTPGPCWWITSSASGRERGMKGLFQFETNQFQFCLPPRSSARKFRFCLRIRRDNCGPEHPMVWGCWNGQDWKTYTRRDGLSGNAISAMAEDAAGNLWVGTEGRRLELFQRRQICFLPGIGRRPFRQRHFLPLSWIKRATCGWAPRVMAWPGFIRANGRVIRSAMASSATASVTSSKMMRVIYGLAPIWG